MRRRGGEGEIIRILLLKRWRSGIFEDEDFLAGRFGGSSSGKRIR